MKADKLFQFGINKCNSCGAGVYETFILAETQEEARARWKKDTGLCGACMCINIIETHGIIVTDPEATELPVIISDN